MKARMRSRKSSTDVKLPRFNNRRTTMLNQSSIWFSQLACFGVYRNRMRWLTSLEFIPLSFWYDAPRYHDRVTGGTTHGWCTVHRPTVPPDGVPGFHQPDARRVSAAGPALRDRVPNPYGGMADGWETADRTP